MQKVFWESIVTMWSAHKEIRSLLDNLRTELYGERAYFKDAIKQAKSKSKTARQAVEVTPLSILNDSIKNIMREFRRMEEPFLDNTPDGDDLDIEKSGRVSLRGTYAPMDFWRRYLWLQQKSDFVEIANQVTRIQARRIAFETSHALEYALPVPRWTRVCTANALLIDVFTKSKRPCMIWMTGFIVLKSTSSARHWRTAMSMSGGVIQAGDATRRDSHLLKLCLSQLR